jgi:protein-tyrosine phosphatase
MTASLDKKRHLELEGTRNIRDLGGYHTVEGRTTRWKTMLRADNLEKLTPDGQRALIDYGVRTVIDLRQTVPMLRSPNPFSGSDDVRYTHQNLIGDIPLGEIAHASPEILEAFQQIESLEGPERTKVSYCMWLDFRKGQFYETLATLATPGALPALFHCNGGKDRTGLISALVLGLAGVPNKTIVEDYAITGKYLLSRHIASEAERGIDVSDMEWQEYRDLACPPKVMEGTLRHIEQQYGSVEQYAIAVGLSAGQIASIRESIVE